MSLRDITYSLHKSKLEKLTPMPKYNAMEAYIKWSSLCSIRLHYTQGDYTEPGKLTPGDLRPNIDPDVPGMRKILATVWNQTQVTLSTARLCTHFADLATLSKPYHRFLLHVRSPVHVCLCFGSYENTHILKFHCYFHCCTVHFYDSSTTSHQQMH
jgi:hypothetical protein